ncbi:outer membrane lipoprotein-sorting protein [bacterium]|nr:MAG: outer membrane lipoprotein-sorting protein [bacterium]
MPTIVVVLLLLVFAGSLRAQDAREIVRRANDLMRGSSTYSEFSMTIQKPEWSRTVVLKAWSREPDYSLVYVTEPARDRGSVTLKRKNEVWNWLPSVQRVIKIPPSMMLQSWMGSDFTNDDLVRQSSIVDDYTQTIAGEDTMAGRTCWKIELTPKPEAGVVWGKLHMWISQTGYLELRTDFYDEDGTLIKKFTGSDIRTFDGRSIASHWEMVPVQEPGKMTVLDYQQLKFNVNLDQSFFSEQNMKRVR